MTGGLEAASGIAILASLFKAAMIKIALGKGGLAVARRT